MTRICDILQQQPGNNPNMAGHILLNYLLRNLCPLNVCKLPKDTTTIVASTLQAFYKNSYMSKFSFLLTSDAYYILGTELKQNYPQHVWTYPFPSSTSNTQHLYSTVHLLHAHVARDIQNLGNIQKIGFNDYILLLRIRLLILSSKKEFQPHLHYKVRISFPMFVKNYGKVIVLIQLLNTINLVNIVCQKIVTFFIQEAQPLKIYSKQCEEFVKKIVESFQQSDSLIN